MGLWSAADDLLKGARKAQRVLDPGSVPAVRNLDGVNFNFAGQAPPIASRSRLIRSAAEDIESAERGLGNFHKTAAGVGLGTLVAGGAGLGYANSQGAFDGINFGDALAGFGTAPAPSGAGSSAPTPDWQYSVSPPPAASSPAVPTPTPTPTAKPQVTDRDLDYVAPSTPTTSSTPGDYVIQKGDTLWDLTGGDWDKINELARINNIKDVDLILAGATLKTPSMDYLNRQLVG